MSACMQRVSNAIPERGMHLAERRSRYAKTETTRVRRGEGIGGFAFLELPGADRERSTRSGWRLTAEFADEIPRNGARGKGRCLRRGGRSRRPGGSRGGLRRRDRCGGRGGVGASGPVCGVISDGRVPAEQEAPLTGHAAKGTQAQEQVLEEAAPRPGQCRGRTVWASSLTSHCEDPFQHDSMLIGCRQKLVGTYSMVTEWRLPERGVLSRQVSRDGGSLRWRRGSRRR